MKATQKKATLDRFVLNMTGAVIRYQCFGIYNNSKLCVNCAVKKRCKAQTPKRRKL